MTEIEAALKAGPRLVEYPTEAAERFSRRAAKAGLIDVAYGRIDSPLGSLIAAVTPRGLVRLAYPDSSVEEVLEELARLISPRVLESHRQIQEAAREVQQYFDGRRRSFEISVDLSRLKGFRRRVLYATSKVPYGKVVSYADIAKRAGSPAAVRAAGNALGANPIPIVVPCHRVLRSDGSLGGYTGGLEKKVHLLTLEGVLPR